MELDPPDGERHEFTGYSVGVANSKAYGGGMIAAPDALLDDGLLEVLTVEHIGRLRFLTVLLPNVFRGTHVNLPYVHVFRAESVEISSDRPFTMYADGDPIGSLPLRLRALPAAVNMLVPAEQAARPVFSRSSPAIRRLLRAGLMSDTLAPKLALARAAGALSRLRGGGATSAPGKVLMRLAPGAIGTLGARLARGSALISATNGKTTTAAMTAAVLRHAGVALVHNEAGANMAGGIATTLLGGRPPAREARRRAGPVRGRRAVARRAGRAASPAGDPARQPVPRSARPLRRARGDRRALEAGARAQRRAARAQRR